MKLKPVVLREAAARDVEDALSHYLGEGGTSLGLAFIDAFEAAMQHVAAHPQSGSRK